MLHNIQQLRFKGLFFCHVYISTSLAWHHAAGTQLSHVPGFFEACPAASGRSSVGDMLALL